MSLAFLNGRFLTQPVTGVQRFAVEITAAIDRLAAAGEWPETAVLVPRPAASARPGALPAFQRLALREIGRMRGHAWEQAELPAGARGGVLVSLGNTAPVLAGRRQVVVVHDAGVFDTPESYPFSFRAWYKSLQRGLAAAGACLVTVSEFSRRRIAARLGVDPSRIAVIPEAGDHILRVEPDREILRRHGLDPGRFVLVVGNLVAHKNLSVLGAITAELERRGLVLAIAGSVAPGVYRAATGVGAGAEVLRLGRVTDGELRALYEGAACLLFPSRYEGFGLPPVEAMACGCPVLATPGGAVEEVCGDGVLYADMGDPGAIAAAMARLLDEDGLAGRLRDRGRARAAALSWAGSARALSNVVSEVMRS
jgi:glycosyltransferase involved in cell wall biosynthesis